MSITNKDLDFWINHNLNVLFIGKHGVGKTARVIEAFNRNNLKWKYFSASTIDPWVDFVGIPKEHKDDAGRSYIDFIRPRDIEDDEVEALFFDEFNRAPKKVLNAVMELIQFKSINGKKLNNLKIIWAAVNMNEGDDSTYSVEKIDPAQLDRFQIHVTVPYKIDRSYFTQLYGKSETDAISEWWGELSTQIQDKISPRRLDYALSIWKSGGNLSFVLPKESNVHDLLSRLGSGSYRQILEDLIKSKDPKNFETQMKDPNFIDWCVKNVTNIPALKSNIKDFIQYIPSDILSQFVTKHHKNKDLLAEIYSTANGKSVIENIVTAGIGRQTVIKSLRSVIPVKTASSISPAVDLNAIYLLPEYSQAYIKVDTTQKRRTEFYQIRSNINSWSKNKNIPTYPIFMTNIVTLFVIKERSHSSSYSLQEWSKLSKYIDKIAQWIPHSVDELNQVYNISKALKL